MAKIRLTEAPYQGLLPWLDAQSRQDYPDLVKDYDWQQNAGAKIRP